jgi:phosphoribosyl 1,2-cyclic phosphate phosphodiesterase
LKITFLGTGTSQGVPVIACDCPICSSKDFRDKRLRSSILIEWLDQKVVIDTGPDFRYQMLRAKVTHLDAILFTHEHKDHTAGLDDIRAFNHKLAREMDVYAGLRVQKALKLEFSYIFGEEKYPGVPSIHFHEIKNEPFKIHNQVWVPILVMHHKLPIFGFRVGEFTYITDAKSISEEERKKVRGCKVLVLNALQQGAHISHLTLEEAISLSRDLEAECTYFTHISHKLGKHKEVERLLPKGFHLAYDQLEVSMDI